jgi:O-antigen/teichoic acid export membrane protein
LQNTQPEGAHEESAIRTPPLGNARKGTGSRSVRGRLLRGLSATALGPVVRAVIQLVTIPLLLHAWGVAKYGDWLILSAIPSYLGLSDLGFGDASGSDMTMRVAAGDRKGAVESFQSSWALLSAVSLCVGLLAEIAIWRVPWHHWVRLATLSDVRASSVVFVLAAYVLVSQQCGILESGFRCDGNFATGTMGSTILRLVETTAGTAMGILTGSLVWAAATYLMSRVVGTVVYGWVLHKKSPWLSFGFSFATLSRIKMLAAPAVGFVALPLANAISLQGFTLVIASVLGSVAVVQFSTLRTLTRVIFQLMAVIAWAMWPELSRAFGEGNIGLARTIHRHAYQAGLALSVMTGSALWFFGPALYHLWIRNVVQFDASCFHILLFVTFVNSMWFISSVVPMSTNAHHRITLAFVALSLISLGIGRALLAHFGLSGTAMALLLIDIPMTYLVLRTSLRQLHEKLGDFIRAILIFPLSFRSAKLAEDSQ